MKLRRPITASPTSRVRRALVVVMLVAAVLVPAMLGGLSYVWCAPMERVLLRSCCPGSARHEPGPAVEQPCCEGERVASLASFRLDASPGPWVPPASLVCLLGLAALFIAREQPPPQARLRARQARAGPSPPLFILYRSLRN